MNCLNCQHTNPSDAFFCNQCGNKLQLPVGRSLSQKDTPTTPKAAERRQLTCLFCDLVGSTAISEKLDAEEFRQVIIDYLKIAENVINQQGGNVAQYLGDGLLVYFGYPKGLENAPKAAVQAALGVIDAVAKANQKRIANGLTEINIRIGINSGLVVIDEHLALGTTVNVAARLQDLAPVNGLVITPQTLKLVQGWFAVKSLGKKSLKGIKEPMEIFQVVKESGADSRMEIAMGRGLSPLVGREKEVETLLHNWEQAKTGKGQFILLNGEAGIGKSRLVERIKTQVKEEENVGRLQLRCADFHVNSPFFPLIDLLEKKVLKFEKEESAESKTDKLEQWFESVGIAKKPNLPIFADYLSIAISDAKKAEYENPMLVATGKRKKFMESFSTAIFNFAKQQPLLLILEDLHWMDTSTLELVNPLIENVNSHPLFIVATTRPQFKSPWPNKSHIHHLNLQRINTDRIETICYHQTQGKKLPAEILAQIKEKTDGVPLFVEELTRMIIESDLLIEKENHYALNPANAKGYDLAVPSTLQDSLITRLDNLSGSREVAQIGAVLGRSFSFELIQALSGKDPAVLEEYLGQLVKADLLFQKGTGKEAEYIFKHALIQDTAYETLLRTRRQQLHQRVVSVLQQQFPEMVETSPQLLAHHLTEAGLKPEALNMWEIAAQKANAQKAVVDAMHHYQKALSLVDSIPDESKREEKELALLLPYNGVIMVAKGWGNDEVKKNGLRVLALCEQQNNPSLNCAAFFGMGIANSAKGQTRQAIAFFHKGLSIAEVITAMDFRPLFLSMIGYRHLILGDYKEGNKFCEQVLSLYQKEKHQFLARFGIGDVWFYTICYQYSILHITGYPDHAKEVYQDGKEKIKNHKSVIDIHRIYFMEIISHYFQKDWKALHQTTQTFLPIIADSGEMSVWLYWQFFEAIGGAANGSRESLFKAKKILERSRAAGMVVHQDWLLSWYASACKNSNWIKEGLEAVDEAIVFIQTIEDGMYMSHVHQLRGDFLMMEEKPDEAEQAYLQAITIAKEQSTKWFELLAAKALARLWQSQGKTAAAYELLNGVFSWFTEGFDRLELMESKTLLAELQGFDVQIN